MAFQSWCGIAPDLVFTQASKPYVQVCYQAEDGMMMGGYGTENKTAGILNVK